jgi:hypothetical protein
LVRFERKDSIFAFDYTVVFKAEMASFEVILRRGGCFEGAYRCVERFIAAKTERLDGVCSTPAGQLDFRSDMYYWMFERMYEQFRDDLESAIAAKISCLEGNLGEVVVEQRTRLLIGLLSHLRNTTDDEIRRAQLSPQTIGFLKSIGFDFFSEVG